MHAGVFYAETPRRAGKGCVRDSCDLSNLLFFADILLSAVREDVAETAAASASEHRDAMCLLAPRLERGAESTDVPH